MGLRSFAAIVILGVISSDLAAQDPPTSVRIETVSGQGQTLSVGSVASQPFVARVVRTADAVPMPGVRVVLFPNISFCIPLDPNCQEPPIDLYGEFEPPFDGSLTTDSQGLATTPPFRAGSLPGSYEVAAMIDPNQSGIVAAPGQQIALFQITQTAGAGTAARPVPGPGIAFLILLALLTMAVALVQLRR